MLDRVRILAKEPCSRPPPRRPVWRCFLDHTDPWAIDRAAHGAIDHGDAADGEDGDTDEEFVEISEDELGDVLTDALELYAQEGGMPDPRICTFRDAGFSP